MNKYLFILFVFIFNFAAEAQVGSATDALGGTGIGVSHPIDSLFLNPAALTFAKKFYGDTQYYRRNYTGGDNLDQFSVVLVDATEEAAFPGGLAYRRRNFNVGGNEIREHLFQLGAALALTKTVSVGLSGYLQRTNVSTGGDYDQKNMDASIFWAAHPTFSFGFIAKGLFGSKTVEFAETQIKPSAGFGSQYTVAEVLRLRADATYQYEGNPDKRWTHNVGAEFYMQNEFILRAGYKLDDYKGEGFYSVGLGWEGPRLKVAYAFQDETRHDYGTSHTVDIWLDF